MRRKDRQISEAEALEVIDQSGYGVLATVNADGSPYVVPVSPARNGKVLYFHCAKAGQKIENIQRDARVCLSFVSYFRNDALLYTTKYQSAVVTGHAELVEDEEEKIHGLRLISEKYAMEHIDLFDEMIRKSARATSVYKITIDEITGKANHES